MRTQERKMTRQWSELPQDLLVLLAKRVATTVDELIRFHAVCRSWRAKDILIPLLQSQETKAPFLLMKDWESPGLTVFCPSLERWFKLEMPKPLLNKHVSIVGASHGWFAACDGEDAKKPIYLVDPLSGAHVSLPPLKSERPTFFKKIAWSACPTSSSCTAVAIFYYKLQVAIAKPGDGSWKLVKIVPWNKVMWTVDIVHFNDMFYVLNRDGIVAQLNVHSQPPQWTKVADLPQGSILDHAKYLVKAFDKLLAVRMPPLLSGGVNLFEIKGLGKGACELVPLNGPGYVTLFLSDVSSCGHLAPQKGGTNCMENCLYYYTNYWSVSTRRSLSCYSFDNDSARCICDVSNYYHERWPWAEWLELNVAQLYIKLSNRLV